MTRPARLDPYVRRAQPKTITWSLRLTSAESEKLYAVSRMQEMTPEDLLSEIVGKVLGDDLVDAVLDR